jgi:transposase
MKHESIEVWRERVRRWDASGLSAEQFAAREGCKARTLENWRGRLRKAGSRALSTRRPTQPVRSGFVEVLSSAVVGAFTTASAAETQQERPFEVMLPSGARVTVPARFDGESLRALITLLGSR